MPREFCVELQLVEANTDSDGVWLDHEAIRSAVIGTYDNTGEAAEHFLRSMWGNANLAINIHSNVNTITFERMVTCIQHELPNGILWTLCSHADFLSHRVHEVTLGSDRLCIVTWDGVRDGCTSIPLDNCRLSLIRYGFLLMRYTIGLGGDVHVFFNTLTRDVVGSDNLQHPMQCPAQFVRNNHQRHHALLTNGQTMEENQ